MKNVLIAVLSAAVVAVAITGCAMLGRGPDKMNVSPSIPAAEGYTEFGKARNGNTSIDLTVKHLANPEKLTPPAHNYVVWVRANQKADAQNIGALAVDDKLTGRLTTVTALHTFDLFITGETTGQVQQPTGDQLLWTSHTD